MRFASISKVLGMFLMIFSISMLPPMVVSLFYHEHNEVAFLGGFTVTFLSGFFMWMPFYSFKHEFKIRDGFLIVSLFWVVLSVFAAIPMMLLLYPNMTFTNAMFESVSGLTTTGASIIRHLNQLPRSMLYYRQQLHFLGGMGIIVLAVAIFPMLGIGGMQLYRAETVGPIKTTKLQPRIAQTAKALWYIYVGLIILCTLSYWLAGTTLFDAIGWSFSTVSTGGFFMHDLGFAYYNKPIIDCVGIFFMIAGATNFSLHFIFLRNRSLSVYYRNSEFFTFFVLLIIASTVVSVSLIFYQAYGYGLSVLNAVFTVVSVSTTTGLTNSSFNLWPNFIPYLIMFLAMVGGCSGSTSGGIKVIRFQMVGVQGLRELKRLIHPQMVISMKVGGEVLPDSIVQSIWGFISVYLTLFVLLLLGLLGSGLNLQTAFGALASCFSNTGAAIGSVATNFYYIPAVAKWMLVFSMIAGRLEVFTLLVLFTPSYWRR